MVSTVSSAFEEFDGHLNLDPGERRHAQDLHREIRELLEDNGQVKDSFLQGSFARKTMLKPLKDVDIVIILASDAWPGLDGPSGPAQAMEFFRRCVAEHWPGALFDQGEAPAAKALRVHLPGVEFTIDLVPALDDADGRYVLIGDRELGEWIPSNTRIQITNVQKRNVLTGGTFVHQVRMFKALIKHHPELDFFKGIAAESLAYQVITASVAPQEALLKLLQAAPQILAGPLLEPAGEDDMTGKWSPAERQLARKVLGEAAQGAGEAIALEASGDARAAIGVWHEILGSDFPEPEPISEHQAMKNWASGSIATGGYLSPSTAGVAQTQPRRAWRSS
ncbi:nucleotidyltransferase [Cellulomonas sp. JH27-2]|uniref:nucleotidyltransferase domain-containing protein n=1 Tax=Cellulomonas sp. JH27-2 TaxID=2774139 RepID=UPI001784C50A|nr:nucleotidyltransferase [Cellulomonas sp. JH27-2]MBD8057871.1 nucleotidyltransferase [Cellulomonas sp. JH27-2]